MPSAVAPLPGVFCDNGGGDGGVEGGMGEFDCRTNQQQPNKQQTLSAADDVGNTFACDWWI